MAEVGEPSRGLPLLPVLCQPTARAAPGAGPHLLPNDKPSLTRGCFHTAAGLALLVLTGGRELCKGKEVTLESPSGHSPCLWPPKNPPTS